MPAMNKTQRDRIIERLRSFAATKIQHMMNKATAARPGHLLTTMTIEQMVSGIRDGSISVCPGKERSNLSYGVATDLIMTQDIPAAIRYQEEWAACEKLSNDMKAEIERVHDALIFQSVDGVQEIMDSFAAKFDL